MHIHSPQQNDGSGQRMRDYLAQLREYRPEFAEFLALCERGYPPDTACNFILRRIDALTVQEEGTPVLRASLLALKEGLGSGALPGSLAECCYALLHESQMALTFTESASTVEEWTFFDHDVMHSEAKPRLLAVDDDRVVRESLAQVFSRDTAFETASNGREALALIKAAPPALVILDDFMPEMTGFKLLETLSDEGLLARMQVIMVTASDRPQDIARAKAAGAAVHMSKPFNLCDLRRMVMSRLYLKKY